MTVRKGDERDAGLAARERAADDWDRATNFGQDVAPAREAGPLSDGKPTSSRS